MRYFAEIDVSLEVSSAVRGDAEGRIVRVHPSVIGQYVLDQTATEK
jgi:hypothetical protein